MALLRCFQYLTHLFVDLFRVALLSSRVQELSTIPDLTPAGYMYIGYPPISEIDSSKSFIKLPLVKFTWDKPPGFQLEISFDYYSFRTKIIDANPEAIALQSLPSIDRLLEAYSYSPQLSVRGPFQGLERAFKDFSEHYCMTVVDVPLASSKEFLYTSKVSNNY